MELRVADKRDYPDCDGYLIEALHPRYGWSVLAYDEMGAPELCGPFASIDEAQRAIDEACD